MGRLCAFFGHREIPDNLEPLLREQIIRSVTEFGVTRFINGGYGEFDRLAARVVYDLKRQYPEIRNTLIDAYPVAHKTLSHVFDGSYYPKELDSFPDLWHIPRRNKWMADQCDMIIAYVNHAESCIYEPLDHVFGKKNIINLGCYEPKEEKQWQKYSE